MKFKFLMFIPVFALVFLASAHLPKENAKKDEILIEAVLASLRQLHYHPQKIDDAFSERVYDLYLDRLDGTKRFLTQKDINKLNEYRQRIDDEASTSSYEFFDLSVKLWNERLADAKAIYGDLLEKPFNYKKKEEYQVDADKRGYAKNKKAIKETWKKSMKYQIVTTIADMLEAEENKEDGKEKLSLKEIEKKARAKVKKSHDGWFHRLERMDRNKHLDLYINAITSAFDPHTNYLAPKDKQDFDMKMSGRLEGIGARLMEEGLYIKVSEIIPGSPSWKQGDLQAGDLITAVAQGENEAVDIVDMPIDDAVQLIRGKKGTEVRLTVKKTDGSKQIIPIVRDVVVTEEGYVKSSILTDEDFPGMRVGFIHLPKFYTDFTNTGGRTCSKDMKDELIKLQKESVDGIVIDLRFNGGGSLQDVVDMSGLFVDNGPMVQVKSKGRRPYILEDEDGGVIYDGPLIIMVNQYSASASEIMAAALQDYNRALIVGSKTTFGKGTVQRFLDLDGIVMDESVKPLGSVKMTIQKFYRINGTTTQLQGVASDIVLPDVYQEIKIGEKEEEFPLKWDEIAAADYKETKAINAKLITKLKDQSAKRVSKNPTFQLINENASFFKNRRENSLYPLNLEAFKAKEAALTKEAKKYDKIRSNIESLNVATCKGDEKEFKSNEKFKARLQDWHKGIVKDVQIDETMAIMNDLINYITVTNK